MANDEIRDDLRRVKHVVAVLEKVLGPFVEKTTGEDRLPDKPSLNPRDASKPTLEEYRHRNPNHDLALRRKPFREWGAGDLLSLMAVVWEKEFEKEFEDGLSAKNYVHTLRQLRNKSEHQPTYFTVRDADRMLEAAIDFLKAIKANTEADTLHQLERLSLAPSSKPSPPPAPSSKPSPSSAPSSETPPPITLSSKVSMPAIPVSGLITVAAVFAVIITLVIGVIIEEVRFFSGSETGKNPGGSNVGIPLQSHQDRNLASMGGGPEETNISRVLGDERIRAIKDPTLGDDLDWPERLLSAPLSEPPLR